jgi:hypothetical protein
MLGLECRHKVKTLQEILNGESGSDNGNSKADGCNEPCMTRRIP